MSDSGEFKDILKQYWPMILRIISTYEADTHLAQDLEQNIAFAIWSALPRFQGQSQLKTYITRIAQNCCVNHVVKEMKKLKTSELDTKVPTTEPTPEDQVIMQDERDILLKELSKLPLGLRQVMTLSLEGFTNQEIAESLGITANTVGVRLLRGRNMLQESLGKKL